MSELDGANRGRAWRQADLFLADLLGPALPRPRRGPVAGAPPRPQSSRPIARAPAPARMALPPDSAGRLFDRIVHGAGIAFAGEALAPAFMPVALPGSLTPPHALRPGDLVVQRALGEGRLGCLRVLGEDAAMAELYDLEGRIRRDTLVLRAPAGEARTRAEDVPGDDDAPAPPPAGDPFPAGDPDSPALTGDPDFPAGSAAAAARAPSLPSAGGKLYRVTTAQGVTAVYVPEAARATDPVALLVWIHGDLVCGDEGLDAVALVKGGTFPLVQQLSDSRRPCVLVAPSMEWQSPSSHALGKPRAMNAFLDEVRRGLTSAGWTSAPGSGRVILAGHARAAVVLGSLAAGVRDAEWSRGALATVSDLWLLDPTCAATHAQRDCDRWTAFAKARPSVRLRVLYRRESSTALVAECIRDAAAAAGLGNVTVVDSDPAAVSHCEMPGAHIPGLLGGLTDASTVPGATVRGGSGPSVPVATDLGRSAPPVPATAFRRWYITTYHMATEPGAAGDPRVPVLTSSGDVIAEVPAGFFAELALEGRGRLRDGRLLTGDGWRSPAGHDYAPVLAVHRRRYPENHSCHDRTRVSGISVVGGEVKTVRAYAVVPAAKVGVGYGVLRGIPLEPFKTLAADIGGFDSSDPRYRGGWSDSLKRRVVINGETGLVPTGTRVYVRQLDGSLLPNGERHDGWLTVNDTGSSIHGAHFNVFVGEKRYGEPLIALTGGRFVDVWFDGIEARVPAGYDYGFPRR